jgi:hypothetical protein
LDVWDNSFMYLLPDVVRQKLELELIVTQSS